MPSSAPGGYRYPSWASQPCVGFIPSPCNASCRTSCLHITAQALTTFLDWLCNTGRNTGCNTHAVTLAASLVTSMAPRNDTSHRKADITQSRCDCTMVTDGIGCRFYHITFFHCLLLLTLHQRAVSHRSARYCVTMSGAVLTHSDNMWCTVD